MDSFLILLAAIFTSFFGSSTPSMLNMTTLKISLETGKNGARKYNLGVSFVIVFQAFLGILIAEQIERFPEFLSTIEKVAAFIFLGLSFYFYREFKNRHKIVKQKENSKRNSFLMGIILSTLNMFAIPFYFGISASLNRFDWFNFELISMFLFAIGSAIGTFGILFFYGKYAAYIENKAKIITKNINLVLCLITGFISIYTIIKNFI